MNINIFENAQALILKGIFKCYNYSSFNRKRSLFGNSNSFTVENIDEKIIIYHVSLNCFYYYKINKQNTWMTAICMNSFPTKSFSALQSKLNT